MPQAILFDLDGTLVDSNQFHVLAWGEVLHHAGHDFRFRELHDQVGKGADNYVRALVPDIDEDEAEALGEAHGKLFKGQYLHRVEPFPDARALLERCRVEGLRVFFASSASTAEVEHYLGLLDARDLVEGWTSADDVARSKPCPDIFEAALGKAGVEPTEALVVGDTPYDIAAARAAGIGTLAVRSGLFEDDKLTGAIAIYDNVAAVLAGFDESPLSGA